MLMKFKNVLIIINKYCIQIEFVLVNLHICQHLLVVNCIKLLGIYADSHFASYIMLFSLTVMQIKYCSYLNVQMLTLMTICSMHDSHWNGIIMLLNALRLSIHPSVGQSFRPLPAHPPFPVRLSVRLSVRPYIHLFIGTSVLPSIRLSVG